MGASAPAPIGPSERRYTRRRAKLATFTDVDARRYATHAFRDLAAARAAGPSPWGSRLAARARFDYKLARIAERHFRGRQDEDADEGYSGCVT